jgi:hypothetical protein
MILDDDRQKQRGTYLRHRCQGRLAPKSVAHFGVGICLGFLVQCGAVHQGSLRKEFAANRHNASVICTVPPSTGTMLASFVRYHPAIKPPRNQATQSPRRQADKPSRQVGLQRPPPTHLSNGEPPRHQPLPNHFKPHPLGPDLHVPASEPVKSGTIKFLFQAPQSPVRFSHQTSSFRDDLVSITDVVSFWTKKTEIQVSAGPHVAFQ